jgi:hypothetical protein
MKYLLPAALFILFSFSKTNNSNDVLKKMCDRYGGKWYKTFHFIQTTENYRNDSLVRTSTWYEAIIFPDKFRIDFGDLKNGNAVIYNKDSAYNFRNNKLVRVTVNDDDLTFLLGGMYFYPFDSVKQITFRFGYDLNKFHEDVWHGKPVYVIGSNNTSDTSNQLWIDKEKLVLVRFLKFGERREEGVFDKHIKVGNGWSETECTFYLNNKLFQKEYYRDCTANDPIDIKVFDPKAFGTVHWFLE